MAGSHVFDSSSSSDEESDDKYSMKNRPPSIVGEPPKTNTPGSSPPKAQVQQLPPPNAAQVQQVPPQDPPQNDFVDNLICSLLLVDVLSFAAVVVWCLFHRRT